MAVATRGGFKPPRKKFEDAPEELWTEFKATGAEALRNELIEHYLPIVKFTAERLTRPKGIAELVIERMKDGHILTCTKFCY